METSTIHADRSARDRLATSLQQIVDDADQLLKNAQRNGTEHFNVARDKFEARVRHARSELDALQGDAAYQARRAARVTDHAVHEHPYAAIGLTAAVALLVGLLIARR